MNSHPKEARDIAQHCRPESSPHPLHIFIARPGIKKNIRPERQEYSRQRDRFSASHHVARSLRPIGNKPDKDAATLAVGGSGERLAALTAGTVDATPLDVPYVEKAEKLGLVSVLYLGDVVNIRLGGFAVSMEKIRKNPSPIADDKSDLERSSIFEQQAGEPQIMRD